MYNCLVCVYKVIWQDFTAVFLLFLVALVNAIQAYRFLQAWSTVDLVLFPHYKLSVGLFCDVATALDLNAQVQAGKLPYPADLCALLDADFIVDITQVIEFGSLLTILLFNFEIERLSLI